MVVAAALGFGNTASVAISVVLAFFFGYALTLRPVFRAGVPVRRALRLAFASDTVSIAISLVLAFFFGYALTIRPVLRAGLGLRRAAGVAFASDTVSITTMEIIDNAFILIVPGAMAAGLGDALFWWSLGLSLVIAFALTVPVNRWLIARGRGHAVMHELHAH